jgi:hypothetical protein
VLDVYGTEVTVVISHNGQGTLFIFFSGHLFMDVVLEQDPLDRELQSKELARIMAKSYPRPVIFLGYVITKPHASRRKCSTSSMFMLLLIIPTAAPYEILVHDGIVHDIDPDDDDRW